MFNVKHSLFFGVSGGSEVARSRLSERYRKGRDSRFYLSSEDVRACPIEKRRRGGDVRFILSPEDFRTRPPENRIQGSGIGDGGFGSCSNPLIEKMCSFEMLKNGVVMGFLKNV